MNGLIESQFHYRLFFHQRVNRCWSSEIWFQPENVVFAMRMKKIHKKRMIYISSTLFICLLSTKVYKY
jgi:hypothetical protein